MKLGITARGSLNKVIGSQVPVHFDPKLDLIFACDASSYGVGALLAHRMTDGTEKPIAFVSRTLTESEKRYAQIEREGLACVTKVHAHLYGQHFTLITDHEPLASPFGEHQAVPTQASARIQRWTLTLACYEYTLEAKPTNKHGNASAMSCLSLKVKP